MNIIGGRRNRQRSDVKCSRHPRGNRKTRPEIIAGRLGVSRAKDIVFFDPRNVNRVEERRGQKTERGQKNGEPNLAIAPKKNSASPGPTCRFWRSLSRPA
jgi:hypothetical protein